MKYVNRKVKYSYLVFCLSFSHFKAAIRNSFALLETITGLNEDEAVRNIIKVVSTTTQYAFTECVILSYATSFTH